MYLRLRCQFQTPVHIKHNIKICKRMIEVDMIFSTIMNAVNWEGKREKGGGVGGNFKSERLPLIP